MKSKVLIITFLCSFMVFKCFAQTENGVRSLHATKLTLLGLSYNYEYAIAKQTVVNGELMLLPSFFAVERIDNGKFHYAVIPVLRAEPRYYYNFLKSTDKGKRTLNNAASYLALSVRKGFNPIIKTSAINPITEFVIIPKWGLKRTMGQHFIFETAIGVGYRYNDYHRSRIMPGFDLYFGYAF